jgi:hypothetical protein
MHQWTVAEGIQKIEEEKVPRLCFGSRRLFHAQHHLQANGYASHEEWKADWDFERRSQFVAIGSKDETAGNQSCQYRAETRTIKLVFNQNWSIYGQ